MTAPHIPGVRLTRVLIVQISSKLLLQLRECRSTSKLFLWYGWRRVGIVLGQRAEGAGPSKKRSDRLGNAFVENSSAKVDYTIDVFAYGDEGSTVRVVPMPPVSSPKVFLHDTWWSVNVYRQRRRMLLEQTYHDTDDTSTVQNYTDCSTH